ncbi:Cox26p KNAG_0H03170 [Huiozyma naganishii CBS 8797]|uniref:Uncharacterized protein n=1 Tax=Huiozyma naganishii (strain ATCC MYA-139 / BCRC 22969 / CBS 8797 / KCTC 17520 / NBRC 10181 / NCYC 3082 / Yp74L-3) TaxID=1071383 RepID=J7S1Y9_HUIN7|nr:hypothetical protein KNAG_0H03170 [Kazachstania naganishii CBS 8797]CCK71732.1 hypothetical protein KNAG_0H03170 [Kazachstania naganishii CBS 8797]
MFRSQVSKSLQRMSKPIGLRYASSGGRVGPGFYRTEIKRRIPQVALWGSGLFLVLEWPFFFKWYNQWAHGV